MDDARYAYSSSTALVLMLFFALFPAQPSLPFRKGQNNMPDCF
ncbi:hypothetical protein [Bacteroides sp. ET71]|nr:hypothetical protein [Bacteroides sp. ET71]